jgi:hypothetical protein
MATTDNKTQTNAPAAGTAAEATLTELQRAGLGQMAWMSAAMAETLAALGNEVVQFVSTRITEDFKTQHALLNCKDLTEAQKIQAEFVQKALEQYTAETGKLVQLGTGVMTAAMPKRKKDGGPV